ncbi:MAG: twin-arginine translocase TatA/TatE family subunit [Deltaproteobacteria bacterium]|nr:MAG: twin-arginine translocase TatA/TatE family subunit [Deltaproteobacteria bacterium]
MGSLGAGEIILILVVFLLLFGAKRLPEFARSLGKSLREFKKATRDISEEIDAAARNDEIKSPDSPESSKKESQS